MKKKDEVKKTPIDKTKLVIRSLVASLITVTIVAIAVPVALTQIRTDDDVTKEVYELKATTEKLNSEETVWEKPKSGDPIKIKEDNEKLRTGQLSTRENVMKSFDVISPQNTINIPEDKNRKVITTKETTFWKEFIKNKNLYIYFVIEAEGTLLWDSPNEGGFPATYNETTKTTNTVSVDNIPVEVRISKSYKTRNTFDKLENYTIGLTYSYYFKQDPEGSAGVNILTLKIRDLEIVFNRERLLLQQSTKDPVRSDDGHPYDTSIFESSSVIGKGFEDDE